MCRHYGVLFKTFNYRRNKGLPLEQCLDPKRTNRVSCTAPDGREYKSIHEMCAAAGVDDGTYYNRKKAGKSLDDCLSPGSRSCTPCRDPDGNEYPSVNAMCAAHGQDRSTFRWRLAHGASMKEALEKTPPKNHIAMELPDGTACRTIRDACRRLRITQHDLLHDVRKGLPHADAIRNACIRKWPGMHAGRYAILRCIRWPWFLCDDSGGAAVVLSAANIQRMFAADAETEKEDGIHAQET